jgi:hypothetical protein
VQLKIASSSEDCPRFYRGLELYEKNFIPAVNKLRKDYKE